MNFLGYILEVVAICMFISAFRFAKHDFLNHILTEKGKRDTAILRAVAVVSRVIIGFILFTVGLWMVGAFH
jgi:hypothetical protein